MDTSTKLRVLIKQVENIAIENIHLEGLVKNLVEKNDEQHSQFKDDSEIAKKNIGELLLLRTADNRDISKLEKQIKEVKKKCKLSL